MMLQKEGVKGECLRFLMQKMVLLKEKHLEMPVKRERVMKQLVICSVNELQLMVHISGKNVHPLAFFFTPKRGEGGRG